MHRVRTSAKIMVVGAAATLAACSSSGGGVSQSQLETKLKKEPSIQTLIKQGGAKATVTNQLVDCIAKALKKDADPSDLKKYVDGKLNINDVGGKAKGSANNAETDAKTCATNAVQSDKSSPPAG